MRRLPTPRTAVRLLVAALCALALLQAMRPAVYSTRIGVDTVRIAGQQHPTRQYREKLEYLSRELHRQVPAGTRVVIVEKIVDLQMRLVEFATMYGIEVVDLTGRADLEVYLEPDPAAPHGVRLLTRKPAA
ncbi:hypothetical protein OHA72_09470 [Dactylosporangium sp. NBC_01737]|uniref:hypothetical protein n=1 Tax=Dactylosporangium sp. NBC_01737 TaxID=2975959 RepID=UPI002E112622|nr:hypothetical protein OHA72_09470 [Dactylosporangium sp. NBC_01737]